MNIRELTIITSIIFTIMIIVIIILAALIYLRLLNGDIKNLLYISLFLLAIFLLSFSSLLYSKVKNNDRHKDKLNFSIVSIVFSSIILPILIIIKINDIRKNRDDYNKLMKINVNNSPGSGMENNDESPENAYTIESELRVIPEPVQVPQVQVPSVQEPQVPVPSVPELSVPVPSVYRNPIRERRKKCEAEYDKDNPARSRIIDY